VTTVPGFSSRTVLSTVRQFPMRDELQMSEMTPGWSNSSPDKQAETPAQPAEAEAEAEAKVVAEPATESKTVRKSTPRKKDQS
jgi:hypothetical protein